MCVFFGPSKFEFSRFCYIFALWVIEVRIIKDLTISFYLGYRSSNY